MHSKAHTYRGFAAALRVSVVRAGPIKQRELVTILKIGSYPQLFWQVKDFPSGEFLVKGVINDCFFLEVSVS